MNESVFTVTPGSERNFASAVQGSNGVLPMAKSPAFFPEWKVNGLRSPRPISVLHYYAKTTRKTSTSYPSLHTGHFILGFYIPVWPNRRLARFQILIPPVIFRDLSRVLRFDPSRSILWTEIKRNIATRIGFFHPWYVEKEGTTIYRLFVPSGFYANNNHCIYTTLRL